MSPPGRPKGEYRSAQHEGSPVSPPGRPKGEYRSAQHEGGQTSRVTARPVVDRDSGRQRFTAFIMTSGYRSPVAAPGGNTASISASSAGVSVTVSAATFSSR